MEDPSEEKSVRHVVSSILFNGLEKLCYASIKTEDRVKKIAESFNALFPFYRTSKTPPLALEKQPIKELKEFWSTVSKVSGHEYSELEKEALATDKGAPFTYLAIMLNLAYENDKPGLASKYLEPLYKEVKKLG